MATLKFLQRTRAWIKREFFIDRDHLTPVDEYWLRNTSDPVDTPPAGPAQLQTSDKWLKERREYLENPKYRHPVTGAPLKEPFKQSSESVVVTYKGKPVASPDGRFPNAQEPLTIKQDLMNRAEKYLKEKYERLNNQQPKPYPGMLSSVGRELHRKAFEMTEREKRELDTTYRLLKHEAQLLWLSIHGSTLEIREQALHDMDPRYRTQQRLKVPKDS